VCTDCVHCIVIMFDIIHSLNRLVGVMVSVLVIRPKIRCFKPGLGDGFLRAIKIRSTSSFGGEVKPEAHCLKILRQVKYHLQLRTKILRKAKFIIPFSRSSCLLPDNSAVGLAQSSGGQIRSFPLSLSFHHGSPCSYIT
jgi:hypothetical protein